MLPSTPTYTPGGCRGRGSHPCAGAITGVVCLCVCFQSGVMSHCTLHATTPPSPSARVSFQPSCATAPLVHHCNSRTLRRTFWALIAVSFTGWVLALLHAVESLSSWLVLLAVSETGRHGWEKSVCAGLQCSHALALAGVAVHASIHTCALARTHPPTFSRTPLCTTTNAAVRSRWRPAWRTATSRSAHSRR